MVIRLVAHNAVKPNVAKPPGRHLFPGQLCESCGRPIRRNSNYVRVPGARHGNSIPAALLPSRNAGLLPARLS